MMATALKEMTTKTESANDDIKQLDETDNGRLTREVRNNSMKYTCVCACVCVYVTV